ncbi:hypothetical protein HGA91_00090 [candidate division WWE3 bacterium]|nr:hypothetical protein [candidate division WWE3 bacterium]
MRTLEELLVVRSPLGTFTVYGNDPVAHGLRIVGEGITLTLQPHHAELIHEPTHERFQTIAYASLARGILSVISIHPHLSLGVRHWIDHFAEHWEHLWLDDTSITVVIDDAIHAFVSDLFRHSTFLTNPGIEIVDGERVLIRIHNTHDVRRSYEPTVYAGMRGVLACTVRTIPDLSYVTHDQVFYAGISLPEHIDAFIANFCAVYAGMVSVIPR